MSINFLRILKALDHSPRHKSELLRALNDLQNPTVARCAALLHKKCKALSIADFPNPFPRDEPDSMLWDAVFLGGTPLTEDKPEVGATTPKRGWPDAWKDTPESMPDQVTEAENDASKAKQGLEPVPENPLDPDAPTDEHDPILAKPDLPVMDVPPADPVAPGSERHVETITEKDVGPLEDILGDSSGAGQPVVPVGDGVSRQELDETSVADAIRADPTEPPPTDPDPVENTGQGVAPPPQAPSDDDRAAPAPRAHEPEA